MEIRPPKDETYSLAETGRILNLEDWQVRQLVDRGALVASDVNLAELRVYAWSAHAALQERRRRYPEYALSGSPDSAAREVAGALDAGAPERERSLRRMLEEERRRSRRLEAALLIALFLAAVTYTTRRR